MESDAIAKGIKQKICRGKKNLLTRSISQGFMDADVAAAVVREMIHPAWRQAAEASLAVKLTQTCLLGYVTGAVDALLERRGVAEKNRPSVRRAALSLVFPHKPDLMLEWERLSGDSDFMHGMVLGRAALQVFLETGEATEPD